MSELDPDPIEESFAVEEGSHYDSTNIWVIAYSDFMTILMIFFLMLFAHRVWAKKVFWESERVAQMRAAQEAQKGMVQRLTRLASVEVQAQRIDIHLPSALLFESGRADLKGSAGELLRSIGPDLKAFTGEIVVEGHTDNQALGPRSKFKSNWELSVARSFSVIQCLTEAGVDPQHISARGYGAYRPRAANDTPAHRAENRRIEIVLMNGRQGLSPGGTP
jgi:flagellar motor protein MotB